MRAWYQQKHRVHANLAKDAVDTHLLPGHEGLVNADFTRTALCGPARTVKIQDLRSAAELATWPLPVDFAPDAPGETWSWDDGSQLMLYSPAHWEEPEDRDPESEDAAAHLIFLDTTTGACPFVRLSEGPRADEIELPVAFCSMQSLALVQHVTAGQEVVSVFSSEGRLLRRTCAPPGVSVQENSFAPSGLAVSLQGKGPGSQSVWIWDLSDNAPVRIEGPVDSELAWATPSMAAAAVLSLSGDKVTLATCQGQHTLSVPPAQWGARDSVCMAWGTSHLAMLSFKGTGYLRYQARALEVCFVQDDQLQLEYTLEPALPRAFIGKQLCLSADGELLAIETCNIASQTSSEPRLAVISLASGAMHEFCLSESIADWSGAEQLCWSADSTMVLVQNNATQEARQLFDFAKEAV